MSQLTSLVSHMCLVESKSSFPRICNLKKLVNSLILTSAVISDPSDTSVESEVEFFKSNKGRFQFVRNRSIRIRKKQYLRGIFRVTFLCRR